jgi:hypothetical protein
VDRELTALLVSTTQLEFAKRFSGLFLERPRRLPHPVAEDDPDETTAGGTGTRLLASGERDWLHSFGRYVPIVSRGEGPHPDRVWVGRSPSCDLVLGDASVSKLHAAFLIPKPGEPWAIWDARSRNGTFIEDERIEPNRFIRISAGSALRFADVRTLLLDAAMLYSRLVTSLCLEPRRPIEGSEDPSDP